MIELRVTPQGIGIEDGASRSAVDAAERQLGERRVHDLDPPAPSTFLELRKGTFKFLKRSGGGAVFGGTAKAEPMVSLAESNPLEAS